MANLICLRSCLTESFKRGRGLTIAEAKTLPISARDCFKEGNCAMPGWLFAVTLLSLHASDDLCGTSKESVGQCVGADF